MRTLPGKGAAPLTKEQQAVLDCTENMLVVGRPGTGKTTIALLKALQLIEQLDDDTAALFLSFSRAAVQRIQTASRTDVRGARAHRLHLATFHSFCFGVLSSHGPLVGIRHARGVVTPHELAILKAEAGSIVALQSELQRLERTAGYLTFDRLLRLTIELFKRHPSVRAAYARAHPLVVVDEYQDSNDDQDELVDLLGKPGQLIYLGDPDQRIYDYLPGVRGDRFERLQRRAGVTRIDLPVACHRSGTSDLIGYGRAVLLAQRINAKPKDVTVLQYQNGENLKQRLRIAIMNAEKAVRKKLPGARTRPSVAVLAYRNKFVAALSNALRSPAKGFSAPFTHRVHANADDLGEAWALALSLLQLRGGDNVSHHVAESLLVLARAERADSADVHRKRAAQLTAAAESMKLGKRIAATSLKSLVERIRVASSGFCGDPWKDLGSVVEVLRATGGGYFGTIVDTLDYRSPATSPTLMRALAEVHAERGHYDDARTMGELHLLREHLLEPESAITGRVLMTLHKSKGKEFDAVVIVAGIQDRDDLVLPQDINDPRKEESRRLLSMAIARARHAVVIVKPVFKPCPLLPSIGAP